MSAVANTSTYIDYGSMIETVSRIRRSNRELAVAAMAIMDRPRWLKECCSIYVSAFRQTGKTEWIVRNARRAESDTLVIVYDHTMRADLIERMANYTDNVEGHSHILAASMFASNPPVTVDESGLHPFDAAGVKRIIVDDAFEIFDTQFTRSDFYQRVAEMIATDDLEIILLG